MENESVRWTHRELCPRELYMGGTLQRSKETSPQDTKVQNESVLDSPGAVHGFERQLVGQHPDVGVLVWEWSVDAAESEHARNHVT